MPDKSQLKLVIGSQPQDLRQVRVPGLDKPFEQLTISELVQMRPGADVADTYDVNAFTDNVSVNTSSVLEELGQIQKVRAMQQVVHQARLDQLRTEIGGPAMGRVGGFDAGEPPANEVRPVDPDDDVFRAGATDPFKT